MMNTRNSLAVFQGFEEGLSCTGFLVVVDGAVAVGDVVDAGRQHLVLVLGDHGANIGLKKVKRLSTFE